MSSTLKQRIGIRLKAARIGRSLTQEQLADKIGRTVEAISNIERAVSLPSIETLERLSRHLDVPLKDFFDDAKSSRESARKTELKSQMRDLMDSLNDRDLEVAVRQLSALADRHG